MPRNKPDTTAIEKQWASQMAIDSLKDQTKKCAEQRNKRSSTKQGEEGGGGGGER